MNGRVISEGGGSGEGAKYIAVQRQWRLLQVAEAGYHNGVGQCQSARHLTARLSLLFPMSGSILASRRSVHEAAIRAFSAAGADIRILAHRIGPKDFLSNLLCIVLELDV